MSGQSRIAHPDARSRRLRALLLLIPVAALAACALPRSAPSTGDFSRASADQAIRLVQPTMADAIASREALPTGFSPEWLADVPVALDLIGNGDILAVTIFERDGLNLFPPGPDGGSRLEGVSVDSAGNVQLPYIGKVRVAGLTTQQARNAIMTRMRGLSLSPDVLVSVTERRSQLVAVQGDVVKSGLVPLSRETARLSALLSLAAPTPANLELATVTIRRGGQSATVRLPDILDRPQEDIPLRGGDVVIVRAAQGSVNVLGAAGVQGRVRITRRNFSVMDAVGDARGLNDSLANPAAVYVMRLSGLDTSLPDKPRVFHFDFRNPAQLAIAATFALRDGDAVLISNAPFAQSQKVLSTFSGVLNTARSATAIAP